MPPGILAACPAYEGLEMRSPIAATATIKVKSVTEVLINNFPFPATSVQFT